jgi:hypothetical protein
VLFWLYAPILAIYMRNFNCLCIMVWIHMDAHEYICLFSKFKHFMYFLVNRFFGPIFFQFRFGSHFWGQTLIEATSVG